MFSELEGNRFLATDRRKGRGGGGGGGIRSEDNLWDCNENDCCVGVNPGEILGYALFVIFFT